MGLFGAKTKIYCFSIGLYRLDMNVDSSFKFTEISNEEYAFFPRYFKGETIYHTQPVEFLGHPWEVMIDVVNGKIVKIATFYKARNKNEANSYAIDALNFCMNNLKRPSKQQTGIYIWDVEDGNVVLQTAPCSEDFFQINLFLTSRMMQNLERLS